MTKRLDNYQVENSRENTKNRKNSRKTTFKLTTFELTLLTILGASLLVPFNLAQTAEEENAIITTQPSSLFTDNPTALPQQTGFEKTTQILQQTGFAQTTAQPNQSNPELETSPSSILKESTVVNANTARLETGNTAAFNTENLGTQLETAVPMTANPETVGLNTAQVATAALGTEAPGTDFPGTEVPGTKAPGTSVPVGTNIPFETNVPIVTKNPDGTPIPIGSPIPDETANPNGTPNPMNAMNSAVPGGTSASILQETTQNFMPQTTNSDILETEVFETTGAEVVDIVPEVLPTDVIETLQPPEGTTEGDEEAGETTVQNEVVNTENEVENEGDTIVTEESENSENLENSETINSETIDSETSPFLQTSPIPTQLFTSPFLTSRQARSPISPEIGTTPDSNLQTVPKQPSTTTPDDNCDEIDVIFTVQNSPASQPWDNVKQLIVDFIYKSQNRDNVRWSFVPYSRGQPAEEEIINWTDYCKRGDCSAQDFSDRVQAIPASFDRGATLKPALNLIERDIIPKRRLYAKLILVFIVFSKPRQSFEEEIRRIYENNLDIQLQLIHIGDKELGEDFDEMEKGGLFGNIQKLPSVNRGIPIRTRQTIVQGLLDTMLISQECMNFGAGTPTIIPLERTKASEITVANEVTGEIVVEKPTGNLPQIVIDGDNNNTDTSTQSTTTAIDNGILVTTVTANGKIKPVILIAPPPPMPPPPVPFNIAEILAASKYKRQMMKNPGTTGMPIVVSSVPIDFSILDTVPPIPGPPMPPPPPPSPILVDYIRLRRQCKQTPDLPQCLALLGSTTPQPPTPPSRVTTPISPTDSGSDRTTNEGDLENTTLKVELTTNIPPEPPIVTPPPGISTTEKLTTKPVSKTPATLATPTTLVISSTKSVSSLPETSMSTTAKSVKGDQTTTKNPNSVVTESVEKTTEIQVSTTSENLNFTTLSSTTLSSTTLSSTTLSSTTLNPTTLNPTTLSSSTLNPATLNPTTLNSTTLSPTVSTSKTSTSTSLTTDFSTSSSPFQTNRFSTVTLTSLTPLIVPAKFKTLTATISKATPENIEKYLNNIQRSRLETLLHTDHVDQLSISSDLLKNSYYQQISKTEVLLHFSVQNDNKTLLQETVDGLLISKPEIDGTNGENLNDLNANVQRVFHGEVILKTDDAKESWEKVLSEAAQSEVRILSDVLLEDSGEIIFEMVSPINVPNTASKLENHLKKVLDSEDFEILNVYVPPWVEDEKEPEITIPPPKTDSDEEKTSSTAKPDFDYVGRFSISGLDDQVLNNLFKNPNNELGSSINEALGPEVNVEYYEYKNTGELIGHFFTDNRPKDISIDDVLLQETYPSNPEFSKFTPIGLENIREFIGDLKLTEDMDKNDLVELIEEQYNGEIQVTSIRDAGKYCIYSPDFCLNRGNDVATTAESFAKNADLEFTVKTKANAHKTAETLNDLPPVDLPSQMELLGPLRPFGPENGVLIQGYSTIRNLDDEKTLITLDSSDTNQLLETMSQAFKERSIPAIIHVPGTEKHPHVLNDDVPGTFKKHKYKHRVYFDIRIPPGTQEAELSAVLPAFQEKIVETSNYAILPNGTFLLAHDPCDSAYSNTCDLQANCVSGGKWDGLRILEVDISCTCFDGYLDETPDNSKELKGRVCTKEPIPSATDGPLIAMVVLIVVLFVVILILGYLAHKKRTRQQLYSPTTPKSR